MSDDGIALTLRPVSAADEELLLGWSNDPVTRASSRIHEAISADDHRRWLERRLATPDDVRMWVGEVDARPVGVVRFERRARTTVEVSITVAPDARGRGLARPLLEAGIAAARDVFGPVTIRADILPGNEASLRLFSSAGFGLAAPGEATSGIVTLERSGD